MGHREGVGCWGSFQWPEGPSSKVWWLLRTSPLGEAQQKLSFTTGDLKEELQPQ